MSLLIKALKQAERSHKQSSDLLDVNDDEGLDDRPSATTRDMEPGKHAGTPDPRSESSLDFSLDRGPDEDDETRHPSTEDRGHENGGARGLTTTETSWPAIPDSQEKSLPRSALDADVMTSDAESAAHPAPAGALALHCADDDAPGDDPVVSYPPVSPLAETPRRGDALGLMEMGSLEPEPDDAVFGPATPASDAVTPIALAPSEPPVRERPSLDFADTLSGESRTSDDPPTPEAGPAVAAGSPPGDTGLPDYETAPVVEPATARNRRVKPALVAGIIGVVAGGWFGYQALVAPEFDLPPANDPMMPMPAVAPAPLPTADGPLWTAAELAILDAVTQHGRMVAEGGWIAAAPLDGRVPALPAPSQAGRADAVPALPRAAEPAKSARTAAPSGAERPLARTKAAAAASGGVPAVPAPPGTPAAASENAAVTPGTRSAGVAPTAPLAGSTPEAPLAGAPAVRLKRAMSAAERSALVKTAAYRALRMNRLDDAERLYRDALVRNPLDSDAWIGLASIAAQRGDADLARQQYERALTIDPNDAVAQAGLLSVTRSEEPARRESRLRNLIASGMNSAGVTFELANALAEQDRWLEAQQAYFEASSAEPANADYAFNLAVALDRLAQHSVALQHYRRAITLAASGPASFDPAQARQRAAALEAAAAER